MLLSADCHHAVLSAGLHRFVAGLPPFCCNTIHNLGTVDGIPTIITPLTDSSGLVVLIVIVVWALWQERRWIRDYLKKELEYGTIRLSQYEIACSIRHRTARLLHVLSRYDGGGFAGSRLSIIVVVN